MSALVDRWNTLVPVGYPVLYWPGAKEGPGRKSTTRTPAWTIPSGHDVVSVDGYAGGIALEHVALLVPVTNLSVKCAFPVRYPGYGAICMSDCCQAPAEYAAVTDAGGYSWRCRHHRGLLSDGTHGKNRNRAPHLFDWLPDDDVSASRMLDTEPYYQAMRKALDSAAASNAGLTVTVELPEATR